MIVIISYQLAIGDCHATNKEWILRYPGPQRIESYAFPCAPEKGVCSWSSLRQMLVANHTCI